LTFSFRGVALAAESWETYFAWIAAGNFPDFYRLFARNVENMSPAAFYVRLAGGDRLT